VLPRRGPCSGERRGSARATPTPGVARAAIADVRGLVRTSPFRQDQPCPEGRCSGISPDRRASPGQTADPDERADTALDRDNYSRRRPTRPSPRDRHVVSASQRSVFAGAPQGARTLCGTPDPSPPRQEQATRRSSRPHPGSHPPRWRPAQTLAPRNSQDQGATPGSIRPRVPVDSSWLGIGMDFRPRRRKYSRKVQQPERP
jgi:hypothetical protein